MESQIEIPNNISNAVFINYIAGTQLFLGRCIHDIYSKNNNVNCVIVSVNNLFSITYDETNFFSNLQQVVSDKFKLVFYCNGEVAENGQQSYVFKKLLDAGVYNVVYIHEDCFIQTESTIDTFFRVGEDSGCCFAGFLWVNDIPPESKQYRAKNELFYLNLKLCNEYHDISNPQTFAGQKIIPTVSVDSGLGLFAKTFYENQETSVLRINPSLYSVHRGNMFDSYKVTMDHYSVLSDLVNFKPFMEWIINSMPDPSFINFLCYRQYGFLAKQLSHIQSNGYYSKITDMAWMDDMAILKDNVQILQPPELR